MSPPIRIFISSVQKELELERAAVSGLIATDPFLLQHATPVRFENEPPPPRPAKQPYLDALSGCAVYVLMIANEYGRRDGELSATHHEYRRAQALKLPMMAPPTMTTRPDPRAGAGSPLGRCILTGFMPRILRDMRRVLLDGMTQPGHPGAADPGTQLPDFDGHVSAAQTGCRRWRRY